MERRKDPVGVFDSGVGGISTLIAIRKELPLEDILYFGDSANAPYGTRTQPDILRCVETVVEHLLTKGAKAIVIACNTATAAAAAELREKLTVPIIGIEPALKPASMLRREDGRILVLATRATLSLNKFARLMQRYGEGAVPVPCVGLMELVEHEDMRGAALYLKQLLAAYDLNRVDAVVLGCTHYVFLRPLLRQLLPERVAILDGNEGTARQLRRVLDEHDLLNDGPDEGVITLETSGDPEAVLPVMRRLLTLG